MILVPGVSKESKAVSQKRAERTMATDKEARDHGGGSRLFVGQIFLGNLSTPN